MAHQRTKDGCVIGLSMHGSRVTVSGPLSEIRKFGSEIGEHLEVFRREKCPDEQSLPKTD